MGNEVEIRHVRNNLFGPIPANLMQEELTGLYGSDVLKEINEILGYYEVYNKGADFVPEGSQDYVPASLNYKYIRTLINKEAAFMFAKPLDFVVKTVNQDDDEAVRRDITVLQTFLNNVLKKNMFNGKILKAGKDCFIGKRIAIVLNFNDEGISISFLPSTEFVYETDEVDTDKVTKLVAFYIRKDSSNKLEQEIFKKKYWMGTDGFCHVHEAIYDGTGKPKEIVIEDLTTKFTYVPGVVVVNEGLTGDVDGESDVAQIDEYESWYSRLGSADIDSMRKGMNPIRYTRDMDSKSTENLPISAGAYWDLISDQNLDNPQPDQGIIPSELGYSEPLEKTMERLKKAMHSQLSIPDVSADKLQGVISSGKTFKAIYWELIIRCEEKLTAWKPALEFIANTIIEGAMLYPESAKYYTDEKLPVVKYNIEVENNYPIPEDEEAEKEVDLLEVNAQTMSRKSYMKKWRGLTDKEADDELRQIALERELLEDSFTGLVAEGIEEATDEEPEEEEELGDEE